MNVEEYKEFTVKKIAELRISDEGQEGISAFLEKHIGDRFYNPKAVVNLVRDDGEQQWFPHHACKITWGERYGQTAIQ